MKVQLLIDNPNSWIIPYSITFKQLMFEKGINITIIYNHDSVEEGDVLIMLSCEKIFKRLHLNIFNLVVHESELPKGKGWSPLTWQILEGANYIPVTLFEASEAVDSGVIYLQELIPLKGNELIDELRELQGNSTINVLKSFFEKYPNIVGSPQIGEESFYPRRKAEDSLLDINKTIAEQFNLLRVCDNERYPAYLLKDGIKYIIKIYKSE